jgi:hypothetical protein
MQQALYLGRYGRASTPLTHHHNSLYATDPHTARVQHILL